MGTSTAIPENHSHDGPQRLGIIAGAGRFPHMVLDGAKRAGCHVTVVGLSGLADPELAAKADAFRWSGLAKLGGWVRSMRRARVGSVILAGSVKKTAMYGRFRLLKLLPDLTTLRVWFLELPDKRNDTVLHAVADEFAKSGIIMEECVKYSAEDMAPEGILTKASQNDSQRADAEFGWTIAKEMGRLDIGQSIAVKEREVIAVEAIEGTDRMIERAAQLCPRGHWTMIKVAKPNQDMRFDVPTVGPETIEKLKSGGAYQLVIEAARTLIVDRDEMIRSANAAGLTIVSRSD